MRLYVKENPFIDYIKRRIRRNKNVLAACVGDTGSGKSYAVLRICEVLDPNFSINRVCFTAKKFMEIAGDPKIKPGSCIVLDEAGISMDNYTWWAQHERMLNWLLQTFRYKRLICFITVPKLNFIQKKSLSLFHLILETKGIDDHFNTCAMKPKIIVSNPMSLSGDIDFWQQYPKIKDGEGSVIKLTELKVHLPSKALRKLYEIEKKKYTQDLYNDALISLGAPGTPSKLNVANPLSKRDEEVLKLKKKDLTNKEIGERLGISPNNVSQYVRRLRNKNLV